MMDFIVGIFMCVPLVVVTSVVGRGEPSERLPAAFVAVVAVITLSGYLLSAFDLFGSRLGWIVTTSAIAIPVCFVGRSRHGARVGGAMDGMVACAERQRLRLAASGLVAVLALLAVMQLTLVLRTAPHNSDSMTYHMPRVGYYLQHGNIATFDANFWAQLMHPKNSAIAMSFLVLLARGWTNAAQLLQLIAWPVFIAANFGTCIRLSLDRRAALIASLCSGLLVEVLMQATTTQDDLYIAALGACFVYFSIGILGGAPRREIALLAAAAGIAFGTKSSAIVLLVSAGTLVIGLAFIMRGSPSTPERWRRLLLISLSGAAGCVIFGLPAGYWENIRVYGSPFGDDSVMRIRSISANGIAERLRLGAVNVERFILDFADPTGLPDTRANRRHAKAAKLAIADAMELVGPDIDAAPTLAPPYSVAEPTVLNAHEDLSYWGLWAPCFFLPVVLVAVSARKWRKLVFVFLGAACTFWMLQAFLGVYDPWRGRYFIQVAIFVVPVAAIGIVCISKSRLASAVLLISLLVCCAVSFNAIWYRKSSPWLAAIQMDWVQQVTRNTPELEPTVRAVERLIPSNANLIISVNMAYSEFPLFGERMMRHLYPAPSEKRYQELLAAGVGDFAIFNQVLTPAPGDCSLGNGFYLRILKGRPAQACVTLQGTVADAR